MKLLTLILACSIFSLSAQAAYPVSFTCKGISNNKEKVNFTLKGLASSDPATRKVTANLILNLKAQTNKGKIEIADQKVRGLKTTFGTLIMYSVQAEVNSNDFDSVSVAITNKNDGSSTVTLVDTRSANLDSVEYNISCLEAVK